MKHRTCFAVLSLLACVLVACEGDSGGTDNPADPKMSDSTSVPGGGPVSVPGTLPPVYVHLQQDYESLRASHQAIADVWEALADNQPVRCGEYPAVISPESISAEDEAVFEPLADLLRQAAIGIDQAITLWKTECANPRANPDPGVIGEGLLAVRAAGDALREAEGLLAGIQ